MQQLRWVACAGVVVLLAGCGDGTPGMRVWGHASYQGQPIDDGQIIFVPIEGTPGPSTGGAIVEGAYEIAKQHGPYAGGAYRVEITAYGQERTYIPNASGVGMSATVPDQLIPGKYNRSSTLRIDVSNDANKNEHHFDLT